MVLEANRIIRESVGDDERTGRGDGGKIKAFLLPFFLGALISAAASVLFYLLTV